MLQEEAELEVRRVRGWVRLAIAGVGQNSRVECVTKVRAWWRKRPRRYATAQHLQSSQVKTGAR